MAPKGKKGKSVGQEIGDKCNEVDWAGVVDSTEKALDGGAKVDEIWNDAHVMVTSEGRPVLIQALVTVARRRRLDADLINMFNRACALGMPSVFRQTCDVALSLEHYAYGLRLCPSTAPERAWLVAECRARIEDILRLAYDEKGQTLIQHLHHYLDQ